MIAFSGATAHRNMSNGEDIDLFMIVEDGKLWAIILIAMLWAKAKGLRNRLCMNYLISDAALALEERDAFTAQQAASLKPIYGKSAYDRFIAANPFIKQRLPNADMSRQRECYPEISGRRGKRVLERVLRAGIIQAFERLSRIVLRKYLTGKLNPDSDVVMNPHTLKLHLHSHKRDLLRHL
jgi:hypothetical protein